MRLRALHHRRGIFINSAAVERRLRQSPLSPPEIAFADEQPLAEQRPSHASRQFAFMKFCLLNHENLLDRSRIVEQDALLPRHDKTHEIAVLARHARQHTQRIAPHLQRKPQKRQSLRPRRYLCSNYRHISSLAGNHLSVGCHLLRRRPGEKTSRPTQIRAAQIAVFQFFSVPLCLCGLPFTAVMTLNTKRYLRYLCRLAAAQAPSSTVSTGRCARRSGYRSVAASSGSANVPRLKAHSRGPSNRARGRWCSESSCRCRPS